MNWFDQILALPRALKRFIGVCVDALAIFFAMSLAYALAIFPQVPHVTWLWVGIYAALTLSSVLIFAKLGLYRAVVRYVSFRALVMVMLGVLLSTLLLQGIMFALDISIPLQAVVNYGLIAMLLIGGSRLTMRGLHQQSTNRTKTRVMIYGAGASGRQLAQALMSGKEFHPVAFLDDDTSMQRSIILGIPVVHADQISKAIKKYQAERILLAMPSVSRVQRRQIIERLEPLNVRVQTIPGMLEIVNGELSIDTIQEVRIEDLLGRDPVTPQKHLMETNIRDKAVLVTGAGGSIGSELCRQIIQYEPRVLVLVEVSEYNLYTIEKELQNQVAAQVAKGQRDTLIKPVLASVQNENRLTRLMQRFGIQTVYHAAAYKHVPMVEFNVVEGVRNNIFGTLRTAQAAMNAGVQDFVLISTDKAVRPTNVMGATKRFAELVLQGLASRSDHSTHFSMVRFGNVLGSSGSVIPLFRQQILDGGPVTVTHPEITRYFMTIPEAAQLVIQAGAMGSIRAAAENDNGGHVFVLDMGEPVRIFELAKKLIRLMGLDVKDASNPHGDIEIVYTGLRPGEKLYEELLIGDDVQPSEHERILTAQELHLRWPALENYLQQLDAYCSAFNVQEIHQLLQSAPLGFSPSSEICDLTWQPEKKIAVADISGPEDDILQKTS